MAMSRGEVAEVADWFGFEVLEVRRGAGVSGDGLVETRRRARELAEGRDLVHVELEVGYEGPATRPCAWWRFQLEDSEGYLLDPIQPNDAIDDELAAGEIALGGVAFALYRDLAPRRLWFDTGVPYPSSTDPILLDVPLEGLLTEAPPAVSWREEAARAYAALIETEVGQRAPKTETAALLQAVSDKLGLPFRRLRNGYSFRVPLDDRRQLVLVTFAGADEHGVDLIRFLTICAPATDGANDRELLRINPRLSHGAVGVVDLGGEAMYVVCDTQLTATADVEELVAIVSYLAWRGDELESKLTGGRDLR